MPLRVAKTRAATRDRVSCGQATNDDIDLSRRRNDFFWSGYL